MIEAILEVLRIDVEIADQGWSSKKIGLGSDEKSKKNKSISELFYQREVRILGLIESDKIIVSRSECIRSEQAYWIREIWKY